MHFNSRAVRKPEVICVCVCVCICTQPAVQWVPGLSQGKLRPGRGADQSPSSSAAALEE